jgi:bacterioferritin-associated ferredoxin
MGNPLGFPWMIVCVCNRLNDTRIRAACEAGPARAEDVYALCGVKRNCGRCQETIAEILDETQSETSSRDRAA